MLDEIIIRPIARSDNEKIASIIRKVLIEFDGDRPGTAFYDESLSNMFDAYQNKVEKYYVALLNGEVVGGCGIKQLEHENLAICELQKMYIAPEARSKKIGKKLLDVCLIFAKKSGYKQCYLETFSTMFDALNLYSNNGFQHILNPIGTTGHNACNTWLLKNLID